MNENERALYLKSLRRKIYLFFYISFFCLLAYKLLDYVFDYKFHSEKECLLSGTEDIYSIDKISNHETTFQLTLIYKARSSFRNEGESFTMNRTEMDSLGLKTIDCPNLGK